MGVPCHHDRWTAKMARDAEIFGDVGMAEPSNDGDFFIEPLKNASHQELPEIRGQVKATFFALELSHFPYVCARRTLMTT